MSCYQRTRFAAVLTFIFGPLGRQEASEKDNKHPNRAEDADLQQRSRSNSRILRHVRCCRLSQQSSMIDLHAVSYSTAPGRQPPNLGRCCCCCVIVVYGVTNERISTRMTVVTSDEKRCRLPKGKRREWSEWSGGTVRKCGEIRLVLRRPPSCLSCLLC